MATKKVAVPPKIKHNALQELYFYLDVTGAVGNTYLAWYGQCRAREMSHEAATIETIEHFRFEEHDWFKKRLERFDPGAEYTMVNSNVRPLDKIREAANGD